MKMDDLTIKKLEEAFSFGASDREACFHAGISNQSLYNYQKENPEFVERKESLKETPILKARSVFVRGMDLPGKDGAEIAIKYLERKKRDEFSTKSENTGELKLVITQENLETLAKIKAEQAEDVE